MKKLISLISFLLTLLFCLNLCACSDTEELTEAEQAFVGKWTLEDITYINGKTQLWYPSSSTNFNNLCEQYIGKTSIEFGNTKNDGQISATFKIGETKIEFKWYGDASPKAIKFSEFISLSVYNGTNTIKGSANSAMINTKGKLCINPNNNMIYIFGQ